MLCIAPAKCWFALQVSGRLQVVCVGPIFEDSYTPPWMLPAFHTHTLCVSLNALSSRDAAASADGRTAWRMHSFSFQSSKMIMEQWTSKPPPQLLRDDLQGRQPAKAQTKHHCTLKSRSRPPKSVRIEGIAPCGLQAHRMCSNAIQTSHCVSNQVQTVLAHVCRLNAGAALLHATPARSTGKRAPLPRCA